MTGTSRSVSSDWDVSIKVTSLCRNQPASRLELFITLCLIWLLAFLALSTTGFAEEGAKTDSGARWSLSTLNADWEEVRNTMVAKGVAIDLRMTQIGQAVVSGGKDTGSAYSGHSLGILIVDTETLGWWRGGNLWVEVEGNWGNAVNLRTGSLMPVNSNRLYPVPGRNALAIPAVTYTQFLSPYVGLSIGKVDTTLGDANEFAYGNGKGEIQFFNLAFNVNPVTVIPSPYSTLSVGVVLFPTKDSDAAFLSLTAFDSNGKANSTGFDTVFKGNTTYNFEGRVRTNFFGLTGHQLIGGMYSSKNFTSLDQNARLVIETGTIERKPNSWNVYYNFDQYLYETKKGSGQGIGIFARWGISDGNPNPARYFYSAGIGVNGVIPGRPRDSFGIGYYYLDINPLKVTVGSRTREFGRDEQGVEVYYNVAVVPGIRLTPDVQVIRPGQKQVIATGKAVDTVTVIGVRLQFSF